MKKILSLVCVFIMAVTLVSCGIESPERAVENALNAIKNLDTETMEKYFGEEELFEGDGEDATDDILEAEEVEKLLVEKLSFKILSSEKDGDNATVKVEITNIDMQSVFARYMEELFSMAMEEVFLELESDDYEEIEEEEVLQIFMDILSDEENKMTTSKVELKLSKTGGSWEIAADEALIDAIYGGIFTTISNMEFDFMEDYEGMDLDDMENYEGIGSEVTTDYEDIEGETKDPLIKVEELPYEITILEKTSADYRYMEATFTNNSDYVVTEYSLIILLKDENDKTYLTSYDTVLPGEVSPKFDSFGPKSGKKEDIEVLTYDLTIQDENGIEYYIYYDVKLDKYEVRKR